MKCKDNVKNTSNIWQGVVIEESLDNPSLLKLASVKDSYKFHLEGEDHMMTFDNVEVEDSRKTQYIEKASVDIKDGFYTHLCKDGIMVVIFKNKIFEFSKNHPLLESARQYGVSVGIIPDQMCFERIVDNPFDE